MIFPINRTVSLTLSLGLVILGIAHVARTPALCATPVHHPTLQFDVMPPAEWSVQVLSLDPHYPERSRLAGLTVGTGEQRMDPAQVGLAAVFTEPRRASSPDTFSATITVAVRDLPRALQQPNVDPSALPASLLASLRAASLRPSAITPMRFRDMVGAEARYEYVQTSAASHRDLSTSIVLLIPNGSSRCFLLALTAPSETFGRYNPLFRQVVKSFRFTPRVESPSTGTSA